MTYKLYHGSFRGLPKGRHTQATKSLVSSKLHVTGCLCWRMYQRWVELHAQHMPFTHNRDLAELSCPHGRFGELESTVSEGSFGWQRLNHWGARGVRARLGIMQDTCEARWQDARPLPASGPRPCCPLCLLPPLTGIPHLAFATRPAGLVIAGATAASTSR